MRRKEYKILLNNEEYNIISENAKKENMSFSEYCRRKAADSKKIEVEKRLETYDLQRNILAEINRVGININQIAKVLNAVFKTGKFEKIMIDYVLDDLSEIRNYIFAKKSESEKE